ncbi:homolog of anti-oxidant 1 [Arabidopsis thaliana]|jgi:copper chaperone|nr:homolog of anti-oxidant 1 [Arabidopsis thaliana]AAK64002.1 At1g66240/T6J19_6 [Arabidopsis thaliana]AAL76156.1 At1g66240/T6J19_6 [Arabidopsis thaliana]AEE34481.1 homolog of anti-oxidant 1 [Arabidopsis thaliana]|eukprot:NP_564870.1 homolog of anti-oxidant 1 [Arabidopsis thaliana]
MLKDLFQAVSYQNTASLSLFQALSVVESKAMSQTVVLRVAMTCEGCVGAVKRVLGKMEGVESFDVDIKEQKVTVKGNVQPDAVLQTVTKTGKKTAFWEAEGETAKA